MQTFAHKAVPDPLLDVAIIGAGATGCNCALDLARMGYSVALLDRGDVGAATSSRSSRLLYCGLSYLEPAFPLWQIPLHPLEMLSRLQQTRVTMHCRTEMVRRMPQRLTAGTFYFPYRRRQGKPAWLIDAAFRLVARFGSKDVPLDYQRLRMDRAVQHNPMLRSLPSDTETVGRFTEYTYNWPERMCMDLALVAEQLGCELHTYSEVTRIEHTGPHWQIGLTARAPKQTETPTTVRARMIINAAGPWVDHVADMFAPGTQQILGHKGVNILVKLPPAYAGYGLQAFSSDHMPLYVNPWRDHHLIGVTETPYADDARTVKVRQSEVDYLLREANALLTDVGLTRDDVLHAWSGVRPHSTDDGKTPSRQVRLRPHRQHARFVTVTGVMMMHQKYASKKVCRYVRKQLDVPHKTLHAAPAPASSAAHHDAPLTDADIAHIAATEHVHTLTDIMQRRLPYGWDEDLGQAQLERVLAITASTLGWDDARAQRERDAYLAYIRDNFLPDGFIRDGNEDQSV